MHICMRERKQMTAEERDFFATVVATAFANPFSREREELITAGMAEGTIDAHTLLANYCRQLYAPLRHL